jgi:hypothetical protein
MYKKNAVEKRSWPISGNNSGTGLEDGGKLKKKNSLQIVRS